MSPEQEDNLLTTVARIDERTEKLRDELNANGQEILNAIRTEKEIAKATDEKLRAFLDSFNKTFVSGAGRIGTDR